MTAATSNPGHPRGEGRRSRWIPWVFVGCMAVVVIVNTVTIVLAVGSFSGLVVEKPYERGIAYNRMLEAQAAQDALGWSVVLDAAGLAAGEPGRLALTVRDAEGRPLDGLEIAATVDRPLTRPDPIQLGFMPAGEGRYVTTLTVPQRGQWELRAHIERGDDRFLLVERLSAR